MRSMRRYISLRSVSEWSVSFLNSGGSGFLICIPVCSQFGISLPRARAPGAVPTLQSEVERKFFGQRLQFVQDGHAKWDAPFASLPFCSKFAFSRHQDLFEPWRQL
jgi:hypothetical protein